MLTKTASLNVKVKILLLDYNVFWWLVSFVLFPGFVCLYLPAHFVPLDVFLCEFGAFKDSNIDVQLGIRDREKKSMNELDGKYR